MTIKLEVGKFYKNGWGSNLRIVSGPDASCRWFKDELDYCYHEDGCMAVLSRSSRCNLVEQVSGDVIVLPVIATGSGRVARRDRNRR